MKQRINLYAAGCALLILLSFFLLPFYSYEKDDVMEFLEDYELDYGLTQDEELLKSTMNFMHIYMKGGAERIMIMMVPLLAAVLLIGALFIDSKVCLGMGLMSGMLCTAVYIIICVKMNTMPYYGPELSLSVGGIMCCVLFFVFSLLEGFRNRLPGYRDKKRGQENLPPYGYAPQMGYGYPAQPGYGAPQGYPRQMAEDSRQAPAAARPGAPVPKASDEDAKA